jgi:two-component system, cell cycle sensor histidine kinase and response regulator CckA
MPHSNLGWVENLDPDGQLARLSSELRRQLGADGLALSVRDGDELLQAAGSGPLGPGTRTGTRFARAAGGLSWKVIEEHVSILLEDARDYPFAPTHHPPIGAAAAAPIYGLADPARGESKETLGALLAVWAEPRAFAPTILDDLERSALFAALQVELEFALARERAERNLAESVVEAMGEVLLICTVDGRITRANASAEALFGYPRSELIGMSVDDLVPAATRPGHAERRDRFVAEGGSRQMAARGTEIRALRADGQEVPVEVGLSLLEGDEQSPAQVIAVVSDIRDRLRAQSAAERQQRLEAVGQFAGGLAHDVNNALTVILGFARMAHDRTESAEQKALLAHVLEAGTHAGELSKQLLVFARTEPQPVVALDVNAILWDLQGMANRLLGDHIEVETLLTAALPPALGDATQLQQVLVNLVLNSRDAMPDGGVITLRSDVTWLEQEWEGQRLVGEAVKILVSDTGAGMTPETIARATDPFFTTKGESGTGLGLATAYTLIASLGGELQLASAPGAGTEVTIHLPVVGAPVEDAPAAAVAAPAPPRRHAHLRVLLVEDAAAVRAMTRHMLANLGHTVTDVSDPARALELDLDLFDLVVSDVEMPGMTGPQMVELMRRGRPSLPVVFTSGYSSETQTQHRLASGAPFVMKPFSPDELEAAIAEATLPVTL